MFSCQQKQVMSRIIGRFLRLHNAHAVEINRVITTCTVQQMTDNLYGCPQKLVHYYYNTFLYENCYTN